MPEDEQPFQNYDSGKTAESLVALTKGYTMTPAINIVTLYEQAVYCEKNNIEGAFVECGVWKGGAVGAMAQANLDSSSNRRELHLFDAFDDICEPDPTVDGEKASADIKLAAKNKNLDLRGRIEPVKGAYDFLGGHGTIESCVELLEQKIGYPPDQIFYHKGWFEHVMEKESKQIEKIAILRLDGDWYSSTKVCLEYLYPKVVKGGIIIIDDYGYYEGCKKAVDEFFEKNKIVTFLSYSTYCCRYFIKH